MAKQLGLPEEVPHDLEQLRAEVGMLRGLLKQVLDGRAESEESKNEHAEYLAWVGKSAEERTQIAADKKFAGLGGDLWQVSLPEHPTVRVPAHSEYEAVGRYNEICGITGTDKQYTSGKIS